MVIAPDGPAGGSNVLGVTREGATTCPLAKLGASKSAQARNKQAARPAASGCAGNPAAIGVSVASKNSPQMAQPVRIQQEIAQGKNESNGFYGELGRVFDRLAPLRKDCAEWATVNGDPLNRAGELLSYEGIKCRAGLSSGKQSQGNTQNLCARGGLR
jgi:hypothetical protein